MIRKFEIVKGQREYAVPMTAGIEYCVSGSGAFTVEVLDGNNEVYGVCVNESHVMLPKFSRGCNMRLIGRDWYTFTIYVSDSRLIGE